MQHRLQNITCRVGQAAPKVRAKTLLAEWGKLGCCSACLGQLATGQMVMLHAAVVAYLFQVNAELVPIREVACLSLVPAMSC